MSINVKFGWQGDMAFIEAKRGRGIPPITLSLHIRGGYAQTYLTADEAAVLGARLLEAATSLLEDEVPAGVAAVDERVGRAGTEEEQ